MNQQLDNNQARAPFPRNIGDRIAKEFQGKLCFGTVINYWVEDQRPHWKVHFDGGGNKEDLEEDEFKDAIALYEEHRRAGFEYNQTETIPNNGKISNGQDDESLDIPSLEAIDVSGSDDGTIDIPSEEVIDISSDEEDEYIDEDVDEDIDEEPLQEAQSGESKKRKREMRAEQKVILDEKRREAKCQKARDNYRDHLDNGGQPKKSGKNKKRYSKKSEYGDEVSKVMKRGVYLMRYLHGKKTICNRELLQLLHAIRSTFDDEPFDAYDEKTFQDFEYKRCIVPFYSKDRSSWFPDFEFTDVHREFGENFRNGKTWEEHRPKIIEVIFDVTKMVDLKKKADDTDYATKEEIKAAEKEEKRKAAARKKDINYPGFEYKLPKVKSPRSLWNAWHGKGSFQNEPCPGGIKKLDEVHKSHWRCTYTNAENRAFSRWKNSIKLMTKEKNGRDDIETFLDEMDNLPLLNTRNVGWSVVGFEEMLKDRQKARGGANAL